MNWQPIETAPEGEDVIAFFPDANEECQRMIAHRLDGDWYPQDASIGESIDDVQPTHWMPLPAPPADSQARPTTEPPMPTIRVGDVVVREHLFPSATVVTDETKALVAYRLADILAIYRDPLWRRPTKEQP